MNLESLDVDALPGGAEIEIKVGSCPLGTVVAKLNS